MGKQSGSQTSTSQTKTDMGPWSAQAPYLTKLFSEAKKLYNQGPAQYYPDSTVAGFTPAQTQGLNSVIGMQGQLSPLTGALQQNTTDTLNGKYLDPNSNPYLAATYGQAADAVTRNYQTATAPGTAAAYSAAGRYGSGARNQSIDQNNRALGTTLNNLATDIYGGNYAQERQNQLATAGNAGNTISALYQPASATLGAGAQQQQQNQAQLSDLVNRFNFNQQSPWQNLANYQGAISGNYGQSGTTSGTQTTPYTSNPLGSALGGLMGLGSLAGNLFGAGGAFPGALAGIFSDERLKEDIAPIGKTNDGQNLYSYRYKGDQTPRVGLMAQEVLRHKPEAVGVHPSGYLMVDYGKALADAR